MGEMVAINMGRHTMDSHHPGAGTGMVFVGVLLWRIRQQLRVPLRQTKDQMADPAQIPA